MNGIAVKTILECIGKKDANASILPGSTYKVSQPD